MTSNRCIPVKSTFGWSHALGGRINSVMRGRIFCCALLVRALHKFGCRPVINCTPNEWLPEDSDRD